MEEQHRSQAEKAALIDAVKKLNREVTRLEAFKKNLIQQLHEGDEVSSNEGGERCSAGGLLAAFFLSN